MFGLRHIYNSRYKDSDNSENQYQNSLVLKIESDIIDTKMYYKFG
jgi:hypothetical protein